MGTMKRIMAGSDSPPKKPERLDSNSELSSPKSGHGLDGTQRTSSSGTAAHLASPSVTSSKISPPVGPTPSIRIPSSVSGARAQRGVSAGVTQGGGHAGQEMQSTAGGEMDSDRSVATQRMMLHSTADGGSSQKSLFRTSNADAERITGEAKYKRKVGTRGVQAHSGARD